SADEPQPTFAPYTATGSGGAAGAATPVGFGGTGGSSNPSGAGAACGSHAVTAPSPMVSPLSPAFTATVRALTPPRPISGGTLLVSRDGKLAVAADSDRDRVYVVDLEQRALRWDVALEAGDEPGRVVEDGAGRVHV